MPRSRHSVDFLTKPMQSKDLVAALARMRRRSGSGRREQRTAYTRCEHHYLKRHRAAKEPSGGRRRRMLTKWILRTAQDVEMSGIVYRIFANVFESSSRSLAFFVFSRVLAMSFCSRAFLVGRVLFS